ncbi:MAG: septum formation initiator family protein [Vicinamibacterales bacterium]
MSDSTPRDDARGPRPTSGATVRRLVRYGLMALTAVVLIDAIVGEKGLLALLRAREEYRELQSSLRGVRVENQRLREQARRFREDPITIEELARKDLGLIKPGEKLFIIRDQPGSAPR